MTRNLNLSAVCIAALSLSAFITGLGKEAAPPSDVRKVDFNRDVLPILAEHCFRCHGPDAAAVAADLRLDKYETATADRGGYRAISPGDPAGSRLLKRVGAEDEFMRMPPMDSGVAPLSKEQIETIRLWIESGAEYRRHWAFIAPNEVARPTVSDSTWPRQELDFFVMARLDAAGLKPEAEADKRTLARRAALTLTGLPPSAEELDAFLSDSSPGAYERYVDRLLASPRYGEHQARYWLDAVRYGDTHGLHLDNERIVWPYRDWVVRALNEDLPFDQFTVWQVAGDLLRKPTTDQLVATGFIRMNPTTAEGGAIEEEFLVKNTFDRTDTFSTVFLGLTMGCAKCHDHKYDPVTQKEYYALYGYFNSTTDAPLDGNALSPAPAMRAPSPEQEKILLGWQSELASLENEVDRGAAQKWLREERVEPAKFSSWEVSGPYSAADFEKAFATAFEPETDPSKAQWRDAGIETGKLKAGIIGKDNAAAYVRGRVMAPIEQEIELRLGSDDGIRLWVNGALVHDNKVLRPLAADADKVKLKLKKGVNTLLFKVVNSGGGDGISIAHSDPRAERIERVFATTKKPAMSPAEYREMSSAYLDFGPATPASRRYRDVRKMIVQLEASLPMTLIAQEMDKPRPVRLLSRGEYDQPKDVVERGVPSVLGTIPKDAPNNRLGLAQWLVSDRNPLFGRVFVNRVWQQHFGTPIVPSAENFGIQGEYPNDPDLLDHLALSFKQKGWSMKELHKTIVTSATFRQGSGVSADKLEKDPENLLVSRGPRYRLDAEVVRDVALFVSGTLVEKMGGRGVNTYQPTGLWEAVGYPTSNTSKFVQSTGESLYRRSLYLFWKRTSPPPTMSVFDAPTREACIVNRSRTNTPLQALVVMNGPQFVEAARNMAQRVFLARPDTRSRLDYAFTLATGRAPSQPERDIVRGVYEKQLAEFAANTDNAIMLLAVGDSKRDETIPPAAHAAWTMVCNMILNLDEVVTQH